MMWIINQRKNMLKESWENIAKKEKGKEDYESEERLNLPAMETYLRIRELAQKNKVLTSFFGGISEAIINYANIIKRFEELPKMDSGGYSKEDFGELDKKRRFAHNVLVDSLNIFSRQCSKLGMDNSWYEDLANNREAIADFALGVYALAKKDKVNK